MNPAIGWALAAAALAVGWFAWGWQGLVLAVTLIVFWLLLQFNRALRVMRRASAAPVGRVPNAVMLHARLHERMPLLQVLARTRSLGRRVSEAPEVWAWVDDTGAEVQVTVVGGRVTRLTLQRPEAGDPDA